MWLLTHDAKRCPVVVSWLSGIACREYMNAFAECLLEMNGNEESPAGQRLVRSSCIDISSSCFDFQQVSLQRLWHPPKSL